MRRGFSILVAVDFCRAFLDRKANSNAATLSPDGKVVAIAAGRKISCFDVKTARLLHEWTPTADELGVTERVPWCIMTVLFSPEGTTLAVAVDSGKRLPSGTVVFRNEKTGVCVRSDEPSLGGDYAVCLLRQMESIWCSDAATASFKAHVTAGECRLSYRRNLCPTRKLGPESVPGFHQELGRQDHIRFARS